MALVAEVVGATLDPEVADVLRRVSFRKNSLEAVTLAWW